MIAAFIGLTIAVAVRAAVWWPFVVIIAATGFTDCQPTVQVRIRRMTRTPGTRRGPR